VEASTVRLRDRFGFKVGVSTCACGLTFLNPQMTAEGYDAFYRDGYRQLIGRQVGFALDTARIAVDQRQYARDVVAILPSARRPIPRGGALLDIGGSVGLIASTVAEAYGLTPAVLDPCEAELRAAEARGVTGYLSAIESASFPPASFNVILLCRTIDHLLDIRGTLARIHEWLTPDGLFFVDAVTPRLGIPAIKLDHPYYLSPRTMRAYLAQAGFTILRTFIHLNRNRRAYVCARADSRS
jgi:ubiquinone/menaquinone biosynthesis C-methylase UbiE